MAVIEIVQSRPAVYTRGSIETSMVYEGPITELQAAKPSFGAHDHPWESQVEVTKVTITPLVQKSDGTNYGRMVVEYGWGTAKSKVSNQKQNGWRSDRLSIGGTTVKMVMDLSTPPKEIKHYVWDTDAGAWRLENTTLSVRGSTAKLSTTIVTDTILSRIWIENVNTINADPVGIFPTGVWRFDGAEVGALPYRDDISHNRLFEVQLGFELNWPGWNKNQFGTIAGEDTVHGAAVKTIVVDYLAYRESDFSQLFPQSSPRQMGDWFILNSIMRTYVPDPGDR